MRKHDRIENQGIDSIRDKCNLAAYSVPLLFRIYVESE